MSGAGHLASWRVPLRRLWPFLPILLCACTDRAPDIARDPFWENVQRSGDAGPCPFAMTARVTGADTAITLAFSIANVSNAPVRMYPEQLPWGNVKSLRLLALNKRGERVPVLEPIDDPGPAEPIVVSPGETLNGEYRLCVTSLCTEARKGELFLTWLYSVPTEKPPPPVCMGAVIIPQQGVK